MLHPRADINIQHVLHAAEIFLDGAGNGLHELDAGRRQRLAGMLDLLVARQQLGQIEGGANLADSRPGVGRTGDVVKEVIQQVRNRMIVEGVEAFIDQALHLPVDLAKQPL